MFRITEVVKHLLAINVIMFLASWVLTQNGIVDTQNMLALHYPGSDSFRPYQIATHFFMHGSFTHILFNMFALVMFGSALEQQWGPKKFLFYYFFCAIGAALIHTLFNYLEIAPLQNALEAFRQHPDIDHFWNYFNRTNLPGIPENEETFRNLSRQIRAGDAKAISFALTEMARNNELMSNTAALGASGAIFGLLLAFGMLFPNAELFLIFLPIPIKAKYFIPVLMLVELFLGVQQFSWDNIAHFAHLGGAVSGFLLILYWRKFGSRFG